jgi:hypothetical protein
VNSSRVVDRSERDDLAGTHAFVGGNKYHQTLAGQINERGTIKVDVEEADDDRSDDHEVS